MSNVTLEEVWHMVEQLSRQDREALFTRLRVIGPSQAEGPITLEWIMAEREHRLATGESVFGLPSLRNAYAESNFDLTDEELRSGLKGFANEWEQELDDYRSEIEPAYVIDTMALIWYLKQDKKLSATASVIFAAAEREETHLILSAISLAELYYANKKWGLFADFKKVYADLRARPYFSIVAFMPEDVLDFDHDAAVPEMHDRIIAGLTRRLNIPLVTSDSLIFKAHTVKIVW